MVDLAKSVVIALLLMFVFGAWVFWVRQNDAAISEVLSCNGHGREHFNQCVKAKGFR
jgi:hypothetical protein